MKSLAASIAGAVGMLCALLSPAGSGAQAQVIHNTAYAHWESQGVRSNTASNDVSFAIASAPITLDTFILSPTANPVLSFAPSRCGGALMAVPGINGNTAIATVEESSRLHIGDAFYFRLVAGLANKDPNAVDRLTTQLITTSGDKETITIYETGPNTGVFIGAMPTTAIPPDPVQGDCRLSVAAGDEIAIHCLVSDTVTPIAIAQLDVLADPFGFVFDSEDGTPVDGANVTVIDQATGAPAQVFGADGVTRWPSSVTTGGTVVDANGTEYQLRPGEYRFPLVRNGTYRLVVTPPDPYKAPSTAPVAGLMSLHRADSGQMQISEGSFGRPFTLSTPETVRIDIPVDRPAVAVSVTKTASRATAQPGDLVSYAITVTNTDKLHAKRDVVLVDTPSPMLRLRADSVRLDGVPRPDLVTAAPDGRGLTVRIGTLAAGQTSLIRYAMTVRADASPGQAINKAAATDSRGLTGFASAILRIEDDGIASRMTVIGQITAGGCYRAGPHPGVPGVRVMMEDGSFAITDRDGRYHFDGVTPGSHVVQAAEMTLPEGGRLVNCGRSTRHAGSASSRFVTGQGGSLVVADFYVAGLDVEALMPAPPAQPAATPADAPAKPGEKPANLAAEDAADRAAAGADTDWLAFGDGPPAILFPAPDHNPRAPAIRVVVRHRAGQKVELSLDGKPVDKVAFDGAKLAADRSWGVSIWRGIPLEKDDTRLVAVVRNADGSEAARLERTVHFTQTPAMVELVREKSRLVADGRTRPVLALRVLDRNGRPVHAGIAGELRLSAPYESAAALDAMQSRALSGLAAGAPQWTVKGDEGIAMVELAPTMVSGALTMDFTFGDRDQQRRQTLETWIAPGDLKWTLVGLAEGSLGARTIADAMERTGRLDSHLGDRARVAFYAKGRVLGKALLTLAYDSARQKADQRLLGAIDPRAYYTVYADGSSRRFDAASREKLYVRIEARAFTALFGDYETGFSQTQLARYQRTMTGVKAEGRFGRLHVQGFGAKVSASHRRIEIQGAGLTGPYALGSKTILANSETVVLQVRDRFRSEVIVDETTLTRFADYDIDLISGTITFKRPILSRDADGNPQFIIVDYDADANLEGGGALNAGGRADWTTKNGKLRVGVTAITDTSSSSNAARTNVQAIDVRARPNSKTELRAEAARSESEGKDATAWLVEAEHHDSRLDLLAYARSVDQGFGTGQLNGAEAGRRKLGVSARYRATEAISLTASSWHDASLTDDAHREAVQVKGELRTRTADARLGISMLRDTQAAGTKANSTVLDAGVTRRLLDNRLQLEASTSVGLGHTDSVDLPARHAVAARYALTPNLKLVGSYELAEGSAITTRSGRVGVEAQPWRGARLVTGLGQQTITEYGARSFAAFGLSQSIDVSKGFSVDATVDANKVLGGFDLKKINNPAQPITSGGQLSGGGQLAENFTALTLGATWRRDRWALTARGEWRNGELADRRGLTAGAIRQLGEGKVVGAGLSWTHADGSDGSRSSVFNTSLAFASRPAASTVAMLGKIEYRADRVVAPTTVATAATVAGVAGTAGTTAFNSGGLFANANANSRRLIGSVSANWSPRGRMHDEAGDEVFTQRSELGLFAAVRYNFDRFDGYTLAGTTLLGGLDARIGIGPRVEIGATATVRASLADGATKFSVGPQLGFVPAKDVLLTIGYNVTGFRDRDFAAARNTEKGVFATLKAKFDANSFSFLGLR